MARFARAPGQAAALAAPSGTTPLHGVGDSTVRIFRVTPTVISVLDYARGFGHTDLVTC